MDRSSSYWCYTWNNPPENYDEIIADLFANDEKDIEYIIYGRETGESGTFHLQGFVQFGTPIVNRELANNGPDKRLFQAHWTKARRIDKARKYCMKDGNYTELGTFYMRQGQRSDLHTFMDACRGGTMTQAKAMEQYPDVAAKYWKFVVRWIDQCRPVPRSVDHDPYPWQKVLKQHLLHDAPDPREIIFVVDETGNMGKSWFCMNLLKHHPTRVQYMTPSKVDNMSYVLQEDIDILLMDCPRSRQDTFQYDFIEYIKNGVVFSAKYDSRNKFLPPCHVAVFMNQHPEMERLSRDRYRIMTLDDSMGKSPTEETAALETWEQYLEYRATHTGAILPRQTTRGTYFSAAPTFRHPDYSP